MNSKEIKVDEEYMMTVAKSFIESDVFRCRSWLITAKTMFPNNFGLHFECYEIEKNLRCVLRASRSFSCLLDDFPNELILWKEIENITPILCMDTDTACLSEEQTFFREMFSALPLSTQQKLLSVCAERSGDTMEHCRLVLLLLNRFPQSSTELALKLMDTMITAEKHNQCSNVINCYRKILVCDLGPILVSTNTLNQKNLYKMLTKTTEFYITYAMGGHSIIENLSDTENYIKTPWEDLFVSCERIGKKLSWELRSVLSQSDKRKAWKKVYSFAKKFVIASNNSELSKQLVFCGMILFVKHVYDYIRYLKQSPGNRCGYLLVKAIKGHKAQIIKPPLKQAVLSIATKLNDSVIGITDESTEVLDNFKMAFNYWELLSNKEPMCTDYWKLNAQIKIDSVIFQFLNDIQFFHGKYKNLLSAIPDDKSIKRSLFLVTLYYCVQDFEKCTVNMFELLEQIKDIDDGKISSEIANPPEEREMFYIQIAKLPILQYCVKIMIQILYNQLLNFPTASDLIGHILVLSQMVWPKGKEIAEDMYHHISKLSVFTYPQFSAYITNVDILEEIIDVFMENEKSVLNIFPCVASSLSQRISTREARKEVKEEFRSAMKNQVLRWEEPIQETLLLFFKNEKESLMKTATFFQKSFTF